MSLKPISKAITIGQLINNLKTNITRIKLFVYLQPEPLHSVAHTPNRRRLF